VYCSIIIPTLSRADLLSETLDSLAHQTERDFETIVICDGEDEGTRTLSANYRAAYPIGWVFNKHNLGLPSARNIGVANAQGEVLLFLDDDCLPVAEWLSHHCKHHRRCDSGGEIVILGCRHDAYVHAPSSITERLLRKARERSLADFDARCIRMGRNFSWFPHCGMNSSIRRDVFLAVGGFDPALRIGEDVELGARLFARGAHMIYEPQAVVCHQNPKNLADYRASIARLGGQSDVYRVREKCQRTTQTQGLLALRRNKGVHKLKEYLAWQYPSTVLGAGEFCRKVTDVTGSRFFFRLWNSLVSAAAYWEGVKSEGVTPTSLQKLIGSPMPVLLFHSICTPADRDERRHHLSPRRFRRFLEWLRTANYKSVRPSEWLSRPMRPRSVLLTFDDGYEDFYSEVFPVLQQSEFSATLFVVVAQIGATNLWDERRGRRPRKLLSLERIRELQRYGVSIGSHSLTHAWLPGLADDALRREIADSKSRLEDLLGAEVTCFAYPAGGIDERVRATVARAGYKMAMTIQQGLSYWDDPLSIKRIGVREEDALTDFMLKIILGRSYPQDALVHVREKLLAGLYALPVPAPRVVKQTIHWLRRQL
jgi:peptidoglycan/xylan/chitin deacetylase (PgdA/CDA1 family)/GT2 family glycosyltransferase